MRAWCTFRRWRSTTWSCPSRWSRPAKSSGSRSSTSTCSAGGSSLSIKQAAEGGEVSEEYREAFGEHAYDDEGNYIGGFDYAEGEFTPETEAQAARADFAQDVGTHVVQPGEGEGEGEPGDAGAEAPEAAGARRRGCVG